MLYPVYVWKDAASAYGATVPDMPGVNSAADRLEELPAMIQQAAELMFDGESEGPPPASGIERWKDDADYAGGFWMLVDIDLSRISSRAVRLNVSLPENLVHKIDDAARARRLSRSGFLALAAEHEIGAGSR